MRHMLLGVRPACLGMVLGITASLAIGNYFGGGMPNWPAIAIGVLDLVLLMRCKVSIPKVLLLSAVLGILLFGVLGLQGAA